MSEDTDRSLADAEWLRLKEVADVLGWTLRRVQDRVAAGDFDIEGYPPVQRPVKQAGYKIHRSVVILVADRNIKKGIKSGTKD